MYIKVFELSLIAFALHKFRVKFKNHLHQLLHKRDFVITNVYFCKNHFNEKFKSLFINHSNLFFIHSV